MSEELALTLIEELLESQKELISEINQLTLGLEFSECIEVLSPANFQTSH